jgi:hypothetical protein
MKGGALFPILILYLFSFISSETQKENIDFNELLDQSHFENYSLKKQFYIVDIEPEHSGYAYTYYFNILGKKNKSQNSDEMIQNEFYFDMYYYNREYPKIHNGIPLDFTQKDFSNPQNVQIFHTIATSVKLKNDFYKAEIDIKKNNCLTLFIFLDSEEETDFTLYEDRHDVYFDLRKSRANNFNDALSSYYGHAKESFDLVYNDIDFQDDLFLKIICPYYSTFGDDKIDLNISLISHDYYFDGKF